MSEKKLWNDLREGDKKALETIYRSYFSDLYIYGKRLTQDENTVQDCIQELYIELWNRRDKLSETDAIRPYLYISLKRKIFHTIKKLKKTTETPLEESHFDIELAIDQVLINQESNSEKSKNLKNAFEQLSSRQKEILYLKYYSGMDYDEISEVMDLNYQSARNLVSRAITKLSKFILLYFICMNIMKQII
jgi:RNA polymerase sigma factor (sigma-70 family)